MTPSRILVAGVGNIFLGDDAFGGEVVRRLAVHPFPEGVRIKDFGIRGLDLAYAICDGYDAVILIDAIERGGPPGTLYLLEPALEDLQNEQSAMALETHDLHPLRAFALAQSMGGQIGYMRIVGCEPATFGTDEAPATELSPPVKAAVDEAVSMVQALVAELIESVVPAFK